MTLSEALEDIAALDDDLDRYAYVMDLARLLPPFPEEARNETHRVRGCLSQVWMAGSFEGGDPPRHPPRLSLATDADAQIVRGLVALLWLAFNDHTAEEILATDLADLLGRLRFADQLTPGRQNGLHAMFERVRALATASLASEEPTNS